MALALFVGCSVSLNGQIPSAPTLIYLVRHAESGVANPISVLTDKGRARANDFAAAVREIRFTHILASHTERARQMVEPVALSAGLPIVQLPRPGSTVDGAVVVDATPARVATTPLVDAIKQMPQGSAVLVGGNRENLFAVLNELGVPLCGSAPRGNPADNCVPCRDSSCWGTWFDRLWIVSLSPGQPVRMVQIHYGTPRE